MPHARSVSRLLVEIGNWSLRLRYRENSRRYRKNTGHLCRYIGPVTYTEKMQWRKLFDHDPVYAEVCDKISLRGYIKRRNIDVRMPEIYWSGRDPQNIPFDRLPTSFVLKPSHLSGPVLVCNDLLSFDIDQARHTAGDWMRRSHGVGLLEWGNTQVPRCLIVEEYIKPVPPNIVPTDYKVKVFNGVPLSVEVFSGRFRAFGVTSYDLNWNKHSWRMSDSGLDPNPDIAKPALLSTMINIAAEIAADFDFMRVDFYQNDDELILGELTPYPGSGHNPWVLVD